MNRSFLAEDWKNIIPRKFWYEAMDEAADLLETEVEVDIQGLRYRRRYCEGGESQCGVCRSGSYDSFPAAAIKCAQPSEEVWIITNPPYGERIEEKENLPALYKEIGERYRALDSWSSI